MQIFKVQLETFKAISVTNTYDTKQDLVNFYMQILYVTQPLYKPNNLKVLSFLFLLIKYQF